MAIGGGALGAAGVIGGLTGFVRNRDDAIRPSSWHCQPLCTTEDDCDILSDCTGMTAGFMHCR